MCHILGRVIPIDITVHVISSQWHLFNKQIDFQMSLEWYGLLYPCRCRLTIPPLMRGNSAHPPPFPNWCQSKEITGEVNLRKWKLNSNVFLLNKPITDMSYLSRICVLIISPSCQSVVLHQRKQVECHSKPLNLIRRLIFACCVVSKVET